MAVRSHREVAIVYRVTFRREEGRAIHADKEEEGGMEGVREVKGEERRGTGRGKEGGEGREKEKRGEEERSKEGGEGSSRD